MGLHRDDRRPRGIDQRGAMARPSSVTRKPATDHRWPFLQHPQHGHDDECHHDGDDEQKLHAVIHGNYSA